MMQTREENFGAAVDAALAKTRALAQIRLLSDIVILVIEVVARDPSGCLTTCNGGLCSLEDYPS